MQQLPETTVNPFFLVVYDLLDTRIVAAFEHTSETLLRLVEQAADLMREPMYNFPVQYISSFCSSPLARHNHQRQLYMLRNARNGR